MDPNSICRSELKSIGKDDSWKYFAGIVEMTDYARYSRFLAEYIIEEKSIENKTIMEEAGELLLPESFLLMLCDNKDIGEIKTGKSFIVRLHVHNFFQSARNAFDYAAHIINDFCVGKELMLDRPDFSGIYNKRKCVGNKRVSEWLDQVKESKQYEFIDKYCNLTKHDYCVGLSESVDKISFDVIYKIPILEKDGHKYDELSGEVKEMMKKTHQYFGKTIASFIRIIKEEYF